MAPPLGLAPRRLRLKQIGETPLLRYSVPKRLKMDPAIAPRPLTFQAGASNTCVARGSGGGRRLDLSFFCIPLKCPVAAKGQRFDLWAGGVIESC